VKFVKVYHPTAGEAEVPESSLPHHARAGWRPVKGSKKATARTDGPAHESGQDAKKESE
jgi:hypothetical protein